MIGVTWFVRTQVVVQCFIILMSVETLITFDAETKVFKTLNILIPFLKVTVFVKISNSELIHLVHKILTNGLSY